MSDKLNGWIERARAIMSIVNSVLIAPFMVIVFVGWASGWIPSPITAIAEDLKSHDARVDKLIEKRLETDKQLNEILGQLKIELSRSSRVRLIKECSDIKDEQVRRRCLEEATK